MFSHFCERWFSRGARLLPLATTCLVLCGATGAQTLGALSSNGDVLRITKVDPPNWWAGMPKPMLLVRGEGLNGAKFSLSDRGLRVEKVVASENGHWAQVWLAASRGRRRRRCRIDLRRGVRMVTDLPGSRRGM